MTAPHVSVVVPTHDRARLLPRVLRSVLSQDVDGLEVVVVDDGSIDETPQVLAAVSDPRLRVVRHERPRGVSAARNTGTAVASGRWVGWCDDDDLWSPDKLRLQLEALQRAPGTRWCNSGVVNLDEELQLLSTSSCPDPADIGPRMLHRNEIKGGGSGVMAERDLVLHLGGFDPGLSVFADWDMWARLGLVAPLAVVDLPLVGYVRHGGGMSNDRGRLLAELEQLREKFARLAAEEGLDVELDAFTVAAWMFVRQVTAGVRLGSGVLALQMARQRVMPVVPALLRAGLGVAAPQLFRRRWRRRELIGTSQRYAAYARPWVEAARRDWSPS